jgi:flagellar protein FlaG
MIMMVNPISAGAVNTVVPARTSNATAVARPPVDDAQLQAAVKAANSALEAAQSGIEFSIDSASGKTIVRILDKQTNEVIRQLPSEEMLEIAKAIDRFEGMLLHQKA